MRPLGLPDGSVRAILTLLIVAVVNVEILRGREVELLWTETLLIALAHYFTSRRFVELSPILLARLENEGSLPREPRPLWLPSHFIRGLIIVAFFGVAGYLYRENRLLNPQALSVLGVVLAYLVGVLVKWLTSRWTRKDRPGPPQWWVDLKAAVVLLVLLITATAYLADRADALPKEMRSTTLALVLFYFGSR